MGYHRLWVITVWVISGLTVVISLVIKIFICAASYKYIQSDLSNLILSNLIIIKNLSNLIKNSGPIWADLIVNLINKIL